MCRTGITSAVVLSPSIFTGCYFGGERLQLVHFVNRRLSANETTESYDCSMRAVSTFPRASLTAERENGEIDMFIHIVPKCILSLTMFSCQNLITRLRNHENERKRIGVSDRVRGNKGFTASLYRDDRIAFSSGRRIDDKK